MCVRVCLWECDEESNSPDRQDRWSGRSSASSLCHLRSTRADTVRESHLPCWTLDRSRFIWIPKLLVFQTSDASCCTTQQYQESETLYNVNTVLRFYFRYNTISIMNLHKYQIPQLWLFPWSAHSSACPSWSQRKTKTKFSGNLMLSPLALPFVLLNSATVFEPSTFAFYLFVKCLLWHSPPPTPTCLPTIVLAFCELCSGSLSAGIQTHLAAWQSVWEAYQLSHSVYRHSYSSFNFCFLKKKKLLPRAWRNVFMLTLCSEENILFNLACKNTTPSCFTVGTLCSQKVFKDTVYRIMS